MKNIIVFMVLVLILFRICRAAEPVMEIALSSYLIGSGKEVEARFINSVIEDGTEYYKVKPYLDLGRVSIWNEKSRKWVFGSGVWTEMPEISENMKLRFESIGGNEAWLELEIMDTRNSQIYTTEPLKVWGIGNVSKYSGRLNSNILENQPNDLETEEGLLPGNLEEGRDFQTDAVEIDGLSVPKEFAVPAVSAFVLATASSYRYSRKKTLFSKDFGVMSIVGC